jgi:murein DD-endopeptidase MepM/ murein hydrolase activator NlpD
MAKQEEGYYLGIPRGVRFGRRGLLRLAAGGLVAAVLAGCRPSEQPPAVPVAKAPKAERKGEGLEEDERPQGAPPVIRRQEFILEEDEGGPASKEEDKYFNVPVEKFNQVVPEKTGTGKLTPPLKDRHLTQAFGVPVTYQPGGKHTGVDYTADSGTPILAVANAQTEYVGWLYLNTPTTGRGPYAIILRWQTPDGQTLRAIYSHDRKSFVKAGDPVQQGQEIAEVGSLGYSTGPHLHFEIYVGGQFTGEPAKPLIGGYFDNPEKYFQ